MGGSTREGHVRHATNTIWMLALTVTLAAPAAAQDWAGSFDLEGRHEALGAFSGRLELRAAGPGFEVTETLRLADGREVTRHGTARRAGEALEAELGAEGLASTLEGREVEGRRLSLRLEGDDALVVRGRDGAGTSEARGRRPRPSFSDRLAEKGKHLLVLVKEELREEVHGGARLNEEFGLHRYLHVGVGVGVRPLAPEVLTPTMRASTGPRQVWLVTEVSGGARLPFGTSIPLGDAAVSVGLEPGARARYEVTDRYDLPEGIRDGETLARELKRVAARSFDLPLDAAEAQALTPGARRVLEAQASVALTGNLSIGHEVANIEGIVRIGASARVGGFWRLQGDVRFEVERLGGQGVRLRVAQAQRTQREASADLLLGVATDVGALARRLEPALEYVDGAVLRGAVADVAAGEAADLARDVVRFELRGAVGRANDDEIDVAYRFDLGRDAARAAYDRAIKGDLTAADAAAATAGSGVVREHRVVDVETRTYRAADLALSVILRAGARRSVTWNDLSVEDESGVSRFELFRFTRERSLELFGRERRRAMELDVIRRAAPDGQVSRALRWSLDVLQRSTTAREAEELRRALAGWGLDASSALPDPESRPFRSRYGKTRTRLTVELAEAGVTAALGASEEALFRAYVDAWARIHAELPLWATAEGRREIRDAHHSTTSDDDLDRERYQLWRAEKFVKGVTALAASGDLKERARRLETLAKGADYDLYVISAILALAPRDAVRVSGAIEGERIAVGADAIGALYAPLVVTDPRR